MTQAVFFDLDGTLINSIYDISGAMNRALTSLGQPTFSIEQYYKMVGNGMKKLCRRALAADKQHLAEALLQRYQAEYLAHCCDDTRVYEGVTQLLQTLHRRGLKLAVITNKPHDQAQKIMAALLPGMPLDVIRGQQPGCPIKPDPAAFFQVARQLGVEPKHTLYCGDSDVDIFFAHNAGARGVGCLWGFRGEQELTDAGADLLAARPLDLLEMV